MTASKKFQTASAKRGYIPDYSEANPELKRKMDQVIGVIEHAPDSSVVIANYGSAPLKKTTDLANNLVKVRHTITPQVDKEQLIKEVENLYSLGSKAMQEFKLYLGVSKEILRRYDEVYIPQALKISKNSGELKDAIYFDALVDRRREFEERIVILGYNRGTLILAAHQVRGMAEYAEDTLGISIPVRKPSPAQTKTEEHPKRMTKRDVTKLVRGVSRLEEMIENEAAKKAARLNSLSVSKQTIKRRGPKKP